MKDGNYVLLMGNGCCIVHCDPAIVDVFETLEEAHEVLEELKQLTMEEQEEQAQDVFCILAIEKDREIIEEWYTEKYLYEYKDDEKMKWVQDE